MDKLTDRFLRYVKIDTQSDFNSKSCPSTEKQFNLAKLLMEDLRNMGVENLNLDNNGYLTATIKSNSKKKIPTIGFIAHMDTSPDFSGANVNPKIVKDYNGEDIVLNDEKNIELKTADFPELKDYVGKTLITTDGTTLLGADNKAGIAEIFTAVEYIQNNPGFEHGEIKIGITPDEEIGRGADKFDVEKFGAEFAYTIDGGPIGELEYENFNAAGANLKVNGRNVHPGYAKDKMINSVHIAMELNSMLPASQRPEHTTGREGFFHLTEFKGEVEQTTMNYIVRDHDKDKFESKKKLLKNSVDFLNSKYGEGTVELTMMDQYFNMYEKILPTMHIVETAKQAMEECEVEPLIKAIRGGTDGARLSYMGLPTPNIFTGGHNFHGKFEFIPVESMHKAVDVILKIVELYTKKGE